MEAENKAKEVQGLKHQPSVLFMSISLCVEMCVLNSIIKYCEPKQNFLHCSSSK